MEEIKPKKERKFLKAMGDIALTLFRELVLGIGKKVINKVGNKRQGLVIAFALVAGISYASIDSIPYPITGNKQRLGWQTSGNGLVYRGRAADTITKPSSYVDKNVKAYLLVDSVLGTIFVWRQTYWDSIKVNTRLMPFDSITFNTAKNGTVGVGEVEYNDTQGSLIQGLKGGNVTNVIGQQLHQRVNNRTGAPLAKGDVVYLAGSQGNRITVAKGLAVTDAFSANTFGVVAESIADNQSGFIITEGLITGLNTSALTEDSAVYLSPTVAGALTSTKPQAPQHSVYIGVCVKSNNGSGELFVKIRNGLEMDELHDTRITSPLEKASLYYSGGLWRDTTAALLVSDTASMLANYAKKSYVDTAGRFYARQDFSNVQSSTLTWTQIDTLIPAGVNVVQVYRNGQILLPSQYTIPTKTSIVIAATSYKIGENYTVIFPKGGGGASSGGGSGSLTSISAGTGITVSPNPITTTGVVSADLSILMELTDTSLLNLTTRFASKLNTTDTTSLSNRINAKGNGTVISVGSGYGLLSTQSPITTSGVIRVDSNTVYNYVRDSIVKVRIGNDTIKILKQEYNNVTTDTLTWTTTNKFPIQLRAFILLFRNGQLLINDQYSVIDTNKIKVAATSYKVGENYTLVTVSGIGSAGVSQTGNPIYPEAGIALSTGTTWTTSIPNNSSNWNTAFTDRLKWDGGSTGLVAATGRTSLGGTTIGQSMFTLSNPSTISFPRFNADNTITSRSAANFRNDIGAGTVTSVNVAAGTPLSIQNNTTIPEISMAAVTGSVNGYLTSTDWTTFNNKENTITAGTTGQYFRGDKTFQTLDKNAVGLGNVDNTSDANKPVSTATQTALNLKVNIVDTASMLTPYFRDADTTQLNLTSRFAAKLNLSDTLNMLVPYLRKADTTNMLLPYFRDADTTSLNLTSRFNTKQNTLSGTGFVKASGTSITYDNSTYLTTNTAASTYLPLTGGTVSGTINRADQFNDGSPLTAYYNILNYYARRDNVKGNQTAQITFTDRPGTATFENNVRTSDIYLMTARNFNGSQLGQYLDTTFSVVANQDGGRIGISKLNPAYKLDVNGTFNASGNSLIGGTLGVTGTGQSSADFRAPIFYDLNDISYYVNPASTSNLYSLTVLGNLGVTGATNLSSTLDVTGATTLKFTNIYGKSTYTPFNVGIGEQSISNVGSYLRGGTVMIFPDSSLVNSSANLFLANSNALGAEYSAFGSGLRNYSKQGGDNRRNSFALYTSDIGQQNTNRLYINYNGDIGINDDTPSYKLEVNGTLGVTGATTLSTTTATPSSLLGKDGSNVVGTVTLGNTLNLTSGTLNVNNKITDINTSTYSITSTDYYIDNKNSSSTTIILPLAGLNTFRELKFKNSSTGSLIANGNIIPLSGSGTTTTILPATNAKWCTLVSDGTDWRIMQAN